MNPLSITLRKLRWSLIHRGLSQTLKLPFRRLTEPTGPRFPPYTHPFDIQHNVDTSGLIGGVHLASGHPNDIFTTAYYAIPPSRFQAILQRWRDTPPLHPIENYSFIDLGCGKGRAVMLASQLPFQQVIGVELNPALAQIAANNLETWKLSGQQQSPTQIFCHDATRFTLPTTPCVLYLYNPFSPQVAASLIQHLDQSRQANPAPLDILYFTPDAHHHFDQHPSFTTLWSEPLPISLEDAAVEHVTDVVDLCTAYRWTPAIPKNASILPNDAS